jgi:glycosyltransferase involved in cell wall biosynthesis
MKEAYTVLHIAPTPFFADRGCHIRIRNELEALTPWGYRLILCTYHHGRDLPGLDIRRIPRIPGYSKLDAGYSPFRFIADFLLFFLVFKTVWQERPSLLHGHLHEGALIGWVVKKCLFWRKLTLIMDMQGSLSGELAAYKAFGRPLLALFKKIEKLICTLPDAFLCSSGQSLACLRQDFHVPAAKVHLLEDIVPDSFFAALHFRPAVTLPQEKQIIIYTGSLVEGKGMPHVLEALRQLGQKRQDIFFLLIGYPTAEVAAYARQHQVEKYCLLPGQINYAELPGWLAVAHLALEPKQGEAGEASGKLLHYMAAGLPVVCFDTPNNRQLLGETAYFAPDHTSHGFIAAIHAALEDKEAAHSRGKAGLQRIRQRYSSKAIGAQLHCLYMTLV